MEVSRRRPAITNMLPATRIEAAVGKIQTGIPRRMLHAAPSSRRQRLVPFGGLETCTGSPPKTPEPRAAAVSEERG